VRVQLGQCDVVVEESSVEAVRAAEVEDSEGAVGATLVQEFAESTLTDEERRERAERTRAYLAENFGVDVSDEESAAMGARLRESFSQQQGVAA
jgi:hypothetical protein